MLLLPSLTTGRDVHNDAGVCEAMSSGRVVLLVVLEDSSEGMRSGGG